MKMYTFLIAEIVVVEIHFLCVKVGTISVISIVFIEK